MSNFAFLFAGYSAIWLAVMIYLLRLGGMRRALEKRLDSLEKGTRGLEGDG
jgi:CcmD family protein